ncbi:hypothetical protein [Hansschlegelia sp. KR7-227]|uniref:hypothetical protein n=1 Tax=Hansschlegelia sp. KR7-227 TaxID=3400914 RepID=UPI003C0258A6
MTIAKITLAALAFAVSAGGAFAGQDRRAVERDVVPMSMERTTGVLTTVFGLPASKPTIWDYAAEGRVSNDPGRVVTGG